MNPKEIKLAKHFFRMAIDEFDNHGCNDVNERVYEGWTIEERRKFVKEFHEYNGDPEEYNENFLYLGDTSIMGLLLHKITTEKEVYDYTFPTRLLSFVKDIEVNDQIGQEEKDYIENVAKKLLKKQFDNAVEKWEIDYLKNCHNKIE